MCQKVDRFVYFRSDHLILSFSILFNLIEGHAPVSTEFPPAQVHFSSVESQNVFYGKMYDHQLKVNIGTKLTPFEPQTRAAAPNATSQIVSMGSACSFSSESDTHSITSDDQIFSPEDSTCSDKIKSNYPNQRKIIIGSDTSTSYIKFEEDRSVVTPTLQMRKPEGRLQSFSKYLPQKSINRRRPILYIQSSLSDIIEPPSSKRRFFQGWQGACQNAHHGYDNTLPSLEEAATLFGFSTNTL